MNCEEFPEWVVPCSLDPRAVDEVGLDTWFKIGKVCICVVYMRV